jgi:hypothetical protein
MLHAMTVQMTRKEDLAALQRAKVINAQRPSHVSAKDLGPPDYLKIVSMVCRLLADTEGNPVQSFIRKRSFCISQHPLTNCVTIFCNCCKKIVPSSQHLVHHTCSGVSCEIDSGSMEVSGMA